MRREAQSGSAGPALAMASSCPEGELSLDQDGKGRAVRRNWIIHGDKADKQQAQRNGGKQ